MSGRRLDIPQKQVRALCKGAEEAGHRALVRIGNSFVLLVPEERAIQMLDKEPVDGSDNQLLDAELAAFEAQHGDG